MKKSQLKLAFDAITPDEKTFDNILNKARNSADLESSENAENSGFKANSNAANAEISRETLSQTRTAKTARPFAYGGQLIALAACAAVLTVGSVIAFGALKSDDVTAPADEDSAISEASGNSRVNENGDVFISFNSWEVAYNNSIVNRAYLNNDMYILNLENRAFELVKNGYQFTNLQMIYGDKLYSLEDYYDGYDESCIYKRDLDGSNREKVFAFAPKNEDGKNEYQYLYNYPIGSAYYDSKWYFTIEAVIEPNFHNYFLFAFDFETEETELIYESGINAFGGAFVLGISEGRLYYNHSYNENDEYGSMWWDEYEELYHDYESDFWKTYEWENYCLDLTSGETVMFDGYINGNSHTNHFNDPAIYKGMFCFLNEDGEYVGYDPFTQTTEVLFNALPEDFSRAEIHDNAPFAFCGRINADGKTEFAQYFYKDGQWFENAVRLYNEQDGQAELISGFYVACETADYFVNTGQRDGELTTQFIKKSDFYAGNLDKTETFRADFEAEIYEYGGEISGDGTMQIEIDESKIQVNFIFPANSRNLYFDYGYDEVYERDNYGIEIAAMYGEDVFAAADGKVVLAEFSYYQYGHTIIIEHENGLKTLYSHCSELNVEVGEYVTQGQVIAQVGTTGWAAASELRFEVIDGDEKLNPWNYLPVDRSAFTLIETPITNVEDAVMIYDADGNQVN